MENVKYKNRLEKLRQKNCQELGSDVITDTHINLLLDFPYLNSIEDDSLLETILGLSLEVDDLKKLMNYLKETVVECLDLTYDMSIYDEKGCKVINDFLEQIAKMLESSFKQDGILSDYEITIINYLRKEGVPTVPGDQFKVLMDESYQLKAFGLSTDDL